MTVSGLRSQGIDTTGKLWINRQDALRKLAQADSLKVYKVWLMQCSNDVDTLYKIANLKQSQINNLLNADKSNQTAIELLKNQKQDYENKIKSDEKLLLKERRKKKWALFGGTAAMGILTFLYLTK